jgi:membrane protein implicated in regulation of membrane protease activity
VADAPLRAGPLSVGDAVFVGAAIVGLLPLVILTVLAERVARFIDGLDIDVDAVRTPITFLLGFVSMFGVAGLVAMHALNMGAGQAVVIGVLAGIAGAVLAGRLLPVLRPSKGGSPVSVRELVGRDASVVVAIPAGGFGSVYVKAEGRTHEYSATASADIAAGTPVTVTGALGNGLVVAPVEARETASLL